MYLYETHLHTSETSRCGKSCAHDMVKAYHDLGFSGLVVTDHFINGYSYAAFPARWEDKISSLLEGYRNAKIAGDELGIDVFPGWEFTVRETGEDYLTYGLDEGFLLENVDCHLWDIERYRAQVLAAGGMLIRAHPYREAWYIEHPRFERDGAADAIEVFNGGNAKREYNDKALAYAQKHGLPMTAGSDTHSVETVAQGYIGFDRRMESYRALCDAILAGEAQVFSHPNQ